MAKLSKQMEGIEEDHPELKIFREHAVKRNLQMEGLLEGIQRLFGKEDLDQQKDEGAEIRELFR